MDYMAQNEQTSASKQSKAPRTVGEDEVDLRDIILQLWQKRKFILIVTTVFIAIGLFIAFASPKEYTASCTVVPQTSDNNRNNISGMASMMGINIGTVTSSNTLSPSIYPLIIQSVPFCKEIMQTPIVIEKSNGVPITLKEYYTNSTYQDNNLLTSIKKYTIGLPGVLLSTFNSAESVDAVNESRNDSIKDTIITLTANERKALARIRDNIYFRSNSKDRYITMGYSASEPEVAAIITENLFVTLEKYVKEYKTQKQIDNLDFVELSYEQARQDFLNKQTALASFQDANRGLTTASARTNEQRLRSEYDVAFTIYNELAKQLEHAKLSVKESTPLFTIIEPITIPYQKSAPRRAYIIIVSMIIGLVIATVLVLVEPFLKGIKQEINI